MTELETVKRAKMYLDKLARGIDPITDREMPEDAVLNQVRLARCFYYVSDILAQVIANDGVVGAKPKVKLRPFAITPGQLGLVQLSDKPLRITHLVERINQVVEDPQMKKLSTTVITDWLLEKGFLEKKLNAEGKPQRMPTDFGRQIGLSTQFRQGQYGMFEAVYYDRDAQRFVLEQLPEILLASQEKGNQKSV